MKTQLLAASAVIALLAGAPAMALDPSYDPVLSTSGSYQNTTSNPNLPLQSRPGGVSSGERATDPGEGMPPHSLGLAPTGYAYPTYPTYPTYYGPSYPVYSTTYPAPTYVAPAYVAPTYVAPTYVAPGYVAPGYATTTTTYTTTPGFATTPGFSTMPVSTSSARTLIGTEVVDLSGLRIGMVSDVDIFADRRSVAVIALDPGYGSGPRFIALPLEQMHHAAAGRVMVNATGPQIHATPTYYR